MVDALQFCAGRRQRLRKTGATGCQLDAEVGDQIALRCHRSQLRMILHERPAGRPAVGEDDVAEQEINVVTLDQIHQPPPRQLGRKLNGRPPADPGQ